MQINIRIIPQEQQRYPTIGDYWESAPGVWEFRASKFADGVDDKGMKIPGLLFSLLVIRHEMDEWLLTQAHGISEPQIKGFDMWFEAQKSFPKTAESGDHPKAPYRKEHRFAENLERLLCAELGIPWQIYDKAVAQHIKKYWR